MVSRNAEKHGFIHQFIHYLSEEKNASPHTCRCYRRDLEGFQDFLKNSGMVLSPSGKVEIEKVDRIDIRKYLSFLHRKNRKSSIARKISTLRSFYKYLVREQVIPSNPAKSVSTPKVEKTLPTTLTVDEAFRLMESPETGFTSQSLHSAHLNKNGLHPEKRPVRLRPSPTCQSSAFAGAIRFDAFRAHPSTREEKSKGGFRFPANVRHAGNAGHRGGR